MYYISDPDISAILNDGRLGGNVAFSGPTAQLQPKKSNHGFHRFHGFQVGIPIRNREGVRSSRRDDPAIRVLCAIRDRIFAKMSESDRLSCNRSFVHAPFELFCGYSPLAACSPCNRLLSNARLPGNKPAELEGACLVVYDVGDRKDIYE